MNFTVIVLSGIDRNLSIALSVSSAWNPPFIRLLGPPLHMYYKSCAVHFFYTNALLNVCKWPDLIIA